MPAAGNKLATQMTAGFLGVTIPAMLGLGAVALVSIVRLVDITGQLHEIGLSLDATREVDIDLGRTLAAAQAYALDPDPRSRREFDRAVRSARGELAGCSSQACHATESATPRAMAGAVLPQLDAIERRGRSILDARDRAAVSPADERELRRLVGGGEVALRRMSGGLLDRVDGLRAQSRALSRRASLLALVLVALFVLISSGVALRIARRLSRRLDALVAGTRRVIAGDLDSAVAVEGGGELEELAASFNFMLERLRRSRAEIDEHRRTLEARVAERSAELAKQVAATREAERLASVGLLAGGVAHELNNPLTGILMNVSLVEEDLPRGSPLCEPLARISSDAQRCQSIVADLRMFCRKQPLDKRPGPVGAVVEEAMAAMGHELESRDVAVEVDVAPGLPEMTWDPERIVRVLVNLIANAAQAIGRGGRVTVTARRNGAWLALAVEDDGPGIPPEYRGRIFEPFLTTKPTGTGLGLAISHGIVQDHGGFFEVETRCRAEVGPDGATGTRFLVQLPLPEAVT